MKPKNNFRAIAAETRGDFVALWGEWKTREKRKPSVWAEQVRIIPAGGSPTADGGEPIKYRNSLFPHCVEQMDSADDPAIRKIVLWGPIRDGKTLAVCANIIGRTVTDDPGNIYSVHPIDDDVMRFSEGDIEPMIESCLGGYFVEKKSRDSGRTINFKKFKGGWLRIVNAGSLTKFRGTSVMVLLLHELDALDREAIYKAFGRVTGYRNAIIVEESTGTFAAALDEKGKKVYNSNIEASYDEGDKRKWFCECRVCGAKQWLKFEQIREMQAKGKARHFYLCERCDAAHDPKQWRRMAASGIWFPTAGLDAEQLNNIEASAKFAKPLHSYVRSYWRNGFNSLLPHGKGYDSKLHEFHAQGQAAQATPEALRVWTQEIKCELVSLEEERTPPPAYQPILDGREDYATAERVVLPARALVLTCATDLHGDRLEIEWRAWARNEESWGAGHFVLFGDTNRTEIWEEWTKHLQRSFPHESGATLKLSLALVDGGWRVDPVLATLQRLARVNVPGVSGKIRVSKGAPQWQSVVHNKWGTVKGNAKGIIIGTWCAKSLIYERLKWHSAVDKPSPGFIHFGKCYSDEFIRQVVSESPVFKIVNGKNIETFKNPDGNRNEALDLLVGNLAAFRRQKDFGGWDWDTIERQIAEEAAIVHGVKPNAPVAKGAAQVFSGRGWKI